MLKQINQRLDEIRAEVGDSTESEEEEESASPVEKSTERMQEEEYKENVARTGMLIPKKTLRRLPSMPETER